jgi:hypothetical protein
MMSWMAYDISARISSNFVADFRLSQRFCKKFNSSRTLRRVGWSKVNDVSKDLNVFMDHLTLKIKA